MEDFISEYLAYTQNNEAPAMYHRWSIITAMSAYLDRDYYIKQGHFNIYPNLYTILIGGPGTKKNTAINITKKLLRKANYSSSTFCPTDDCSAMSMKSFSFVVFDAANVLYCALRKSFFEIFIAVFFFVPGPPIRIVYRLGYILK